MILVTTNSLTFNAGSVTYYNINEGLVEVRDSKGDFMTYIYQSTYRKILVNVSASKSIVISNIL